MANAQDIGLGLALVTLVLDNKVNCFSDFSDLIWQTVCIIQPPNWTQELIGPKLMCLDKLSRSGCGTVGQSGGVDGAGSPYVQACTEHY